MNIEKEDTTTPVKSVVANVKPPDWKKEHNQKKFYDPITFKEIKIGYTGDLMDDENIPF